MDADGANAVRLTDGWGMNPVWSPNGQKIAFWSSGGDDFNFEVYVTDLNGENLMTLSQHSAVDVLPTWSPDSTKIAFMSTRDGNPEIYVMGADGLNPVNLTNNPANDEYPMWSPIIETTTGVEPRSWGELKANIR